MELILDIMLLLITVIIALVIITDPPQRIDHSPRLHTHTDTQVVKRTDPPQRLRT
jgi:hypothetical protein